MCIRDSSLSLSLPSLSLSPLSLLDAQAKTYHAVLITVEAGYNNVGYNEVPDTAKGFFFLVTAKIFLCVTRNVSDIVKSNIT